MLCFLFAVLALLLDVWDWIVDNDGGGFLGSIPVNEIDSNVDGCLFSVLISSALGVILVLVLKVFAPELSSVEI